MCAENNNLVENYRCHITRGKFLSNIEDMLGISVAILQGCSGAQSAVVKQCFMEQYREYFGLEEGDEEKTIANHFTEPNALYGLTYTDIDGIIHLGTRAEELYQTQDFMQFFKGFCLKMQMPNCINNVQTTREYIQNRIKFKPAKCILKLLRAGEASVGSFFISSQEAAYFIFNNKRITTGLIEPSVLVASILENRNNGMVYSSDSHTTQHAREFLDYMCFAGLLRITEERDYYLNHADEETAQLFLDDDSFFEINVNYLNSPEVRKSEKIRWQEWFSSIDERISTQFRTAGEAVHELINRGHEEEHEPISRPGIDRIEIGDMGEDEVLAMERNLVASLRPDLLPLVRKVSNDTALGYDIQSVEKEEPYNKIFIEVKTTIRTSPPSSDFITFFPMSGNEWNTARALGDKYYIYRVFLTEGNVNIFIVKNPHLQEELGNLRIEPLNYKVLLKEECGSFFDNESEN